MTKDEAIRKSSLAEAERYWALSQRIAELFQFARPFLGQGSTSSQRRRFWILGLRLTSKVRRLGPSLTMSANKRGTAGKEASER